MSDGRWRGFSGSWYMAIWLRPCPRGSAVYQAESSASRRSDASVGVPSSAKPQGLAVFEVDRGGRVGGALLRTNVRAGTQ